MAISEIIYSTVANKCPRCHHGRVFENNNPYNLSNGLKMKDSCSECHLKYEREPGFFYGALYVSYGLMSGIFIVWFFADRMWLHLEALNLALIVIGTMLVMFPLVYRSARLIWLNFFVRYDKKYHRNKGSYHSKNHSIHKI
ncbi:MAG: DUF983 domain-containing protein [Bacteroidia bacterium]